MNVETGQCSDSIEDTRRQARRRKKSLMCRWMDEVELDLEEYVCKQMEKKES